MRKQFITGVMCTLTLSVGVCAFAAENEEMINADVQPQEYENQELMEKEDLCNDAEEIVNNLDSQSFPSNNEKNLNSSTNDDENLNSSFDDGQNCGDVSSFKVSSIEECEKIMQDFEKVTKKMEKELYPLIKEYKNTGADESKMTEITNQMEKINKLREQKNVSWQSVSDEFYYWIEQNYGDKNVKLMNLARIFDDIINPWKGFDPWADESEELEE
ncbi:MAG: hypothetical protein LBP31_01555 [Holosporales bacterium]|jgi:hypothetical protein|nr:hypothetical protein [Holosporales bacterium]